MKLELNESATAAARGAILPVEPRTKRQLATWVRAVLGFDAPEGALVEGHAAPLDYLAHAFFEDEQPRDCIVWANRGGGKTQLAAIATLLDLVFKPGIQIRILGGSFEQSSKMHRYLRRMFDAPELHQMVDGRATGRFLQLTNGSRVEVLSQSERSVRGQRVHKLRCDEVDQFTPDIWDAAQMVTRSGRCGGRLVRGSIECLSTMHQPYGLMQRLMKASELEGVRSRRLFRWNVLDVLEHCPLERDCGACKLWNDCGGRARHASGFIAIDDALQQYERTAPGAWRAEMLCQEPTRSSTVYPEFSMDTHVRDLPRLLPDARWLAGIDFGYRDSTVFLWACEYESGEGRVLHIADELVRNQRRVDQHIEEVKRRDWPRIEWIGADPAGAQRSSQSGVSDIALWRRAGFAVRARTSRIAEGVGAVRQRLCGADGRATLFIAPRCRVLIESMTMYRYPDNDPRSLTPVKDGHDHAADALRYLIVNMDRGDWAVQVRNYFRDKSG